MADWQEQLNTILSDPDAMAQIASLAQSLGGANDAPPADKERADDKSAATKSPFYGLDPELLRRFSPLLREANRPVNSETAAFLAALRPFLSEQRRAKVERAAQLARLIHLGKVFLTSSEQEDASHV